MKKILFVLLAAVIMLSGCGKDKTEENLEKNQVSVTTVKAEIRDFSVYSTYSGSVQPGSEIRVTPKATGKVAEDYTQIGKTVSRGEVLFQIESNDQSLQVAQAQAAYNSAVANYERTVGGSLRQSMLQMEQSVAAAKNTLEQATLAYANAQELYNSGAYVNSAQASYDTAKQNYERTKELYNCGAVSQSVYENAESTFRAAEAQLSSAKVNAQQSLDNARIALSNAEMSYNAAVENYNLSRDAVNPENEKSAAAQVASAKAALDIAKNSLSNTVVKSPISGTISAENISKGEMASPQSSYATVVDLSGVTISINISENKIADITEGTAATISVEAAGISGINGTVAALSPVAYNGMYEAKLFVDNSEGLLKGGMVAEVGLETAAATATVVIPVSAILTEDGDAFVYINNNGTPVKTPVTVGISDDEHAQILSGLTGGEEIVVKGKDFINENSELIVNN